MKKLFTLLATALVTCSAFAGTVTFTAPGTWLTDAAGEQSETKNGVTISTTQGWAGTVDNVSHYRIYKGQTFTVASTVGNITKVEIACTANGTTKYGPGCFDSATAGEYTYEAAGPNGTWTGSAASFSLTATSNQVRCTTITVTVDGETGGDGGNGDNPGDGGDGGNTGDLPTLNDVNTISNIIACYDNGVVKDNDVVKVEGYITNMFLKPTNFTKYGSVSIWLAEAEGSDAKEFEFYNCYGIEGDTLASFIPLEGEVDLTVSSNIDVQSVKDRNGIEYKLGDKVVGEGKMKKYNSTYELNTGCKIVSVSNSSIEGIKSDAQKSGKRIENGKVYIYSNGVRYNILGQVE